MIRLTQLYQHKSLSKNKYANIFVYVKNIGTGQRRTHNQLDMSSNYTTLFANSSNEKETSTGIYKIN